MLDVKSRHPAGLFVFAGDDSEVVHACYVLANEGRSFYFEPWPNGRCRISVDHEHAGRVRELLLVTGKQVRP